MEVDPIAVPTQPQVHFRPRFRPKGYDLLLQTVVGTRHARLPAGALSLNDQRAESKVFRVSGVQSPERRRLVRRQLNQFTPRSHSVSASSTRENHAGIFLIVCRPMRSPQPDPWCASRLTVTRKQESGRSAKFALQYARDTDSTAD